MPQIEVTFDIDANGILNVTAKDKSTNKSNTITISNDKGRLSAEEIERMVNDAEKFQDEDKKVKEKIDLRNSIENYLYQVKSSFSEKEISDKLGDSKKELEKIVEEGLDWLDNNYSADVEELKSKKSELESKINPIMSSLHRPNNQTESNVNNDSNPGNENFTQNTDEPTIEEVD